MDSKKLEINKVKNRFLPIPESVSKGLEPECKISDFTNSKVLGEGSFGRVYLVTHKKTGGVFAIKAIDKRNKNNQEGKLYFRREIEIMYKVRHPNIVRLFSHFEDDDYCYFVMEYISKGNLYTLMSKQKSKCFEAKKVAFFMRDLISSVYYLHKMDPPIVHRDIKPENILLHEDERLKLTDFGWSNYLEENEVRSTYCGTPVYLAPEMIKEVGHAEHLDIWCIGVLMFELLTGTIPFPGTNEKELSGNILKLRINWPKDINMDAKNLISKILKPDPKDRISLDDMLKHPFFTKNLTNPTEFLFNPSEINDLMGDIKPFLMSEDKPVGYNIIKKVKVAKPNSDSDLETNAATQLPSRVITPISANIDIYKDMNTNIKEMYDKLKKDYENLANSYNELVLSKSELMKKIEDMPDKISSFKNEKDSLIKEIEEKDNEKLKLLTKIAEHEQRLIDKDNKIKVISKTLTIMEDRRKRDEEEINKLNSDIDKISNEKDEEIQDYKLKLRDLQNKLTNDDALENQIVNLRDSMSEKMSFSYRSNNTNFEDSEVRKKLESELRGVKEYMTNEIEILRREMSKDKEKYNIIIKNKETEISKLIDEKSTIRESEAKKYERIYSKYELTLKLRESEIENLRVKIKKYENMNELNNAKKK